jgi:hypothetical protein
VAFALWDKEVVTTYNQSFHRNLLQACFQVDPYSCCETLSMAGMA